MSIGRIIEQLHMERARIDRALEALDPEQTTPGSWGVIPPREVARRVLANADGPLTVREVMSVALENGWEPCQANPYNSVWNALRRGFTKVGKRYVPKGGEE